MSKPHEKHKKLRTQEIRSVHQLGGYYVLQQNLCGKLNWAATFSCGFKILEKQLTSKMLSFVANIFCF